MSKTTYRKKQLDKKSEAMKEMEKMLVNEHMKMLEETEGIIIDGEVIPLHTKSHNTILIFKF